MKKRQGERDERALDTDDKRHTDGTIRGLADGCPLDLFTLPVPRLSLPPRASRVMRHAPAPPRWPIFRPIQEAGVGAWLRDVRARPAALACPSWPISWPICVAAPCSAPAPPYP